MLVLKHGEFVFDEFSAKELDELIEFLQKKDLLISFSESIVPLTSSGKSVGDNLLKLIERGL